MKTLYTCEKCGRQFEDYNDCYTHESSHRTLSTIEDYYDLTNEYAALRDSIVEYGKGSLLPTAIWLKSPVLDDNGYQKYGENGQALYTAHLYELCKSANDSLKADFEKAFEAAAVEHEAERQRWAAERAAKEAAEKEGEQA